ncbi:MAG: flagellar basal body rod protein FlgB [Bacteroidota bacterium]
MEPLKLKLLSQAMQAYTWRSQAVAGNLANLDTPGYQRVGVSFEETLQEIRRGISGPRTLDDAQPRMRVEGDAPVLEDEMMELADTQMRTQLSTRALREHFNLMQTGITGRSV